MTYVHGVMLSTLAACSIVLAYAAHTQPHPLHLWLAAAVLWGLAEVCISVWNREKRK